MIESCAASGTEPLSVASMLSYERPLQRAFFLRRYKRFFVDVQMSDGHVLTVHCANSGSMKSCLVEGAPALIWDSANPSRKLRYSLEALWLDDGWVCLNTARANQLFARLMANRAQLESDLESLGEQNLFLGARQFLTDFGRGAFRSEVRFSANTRFDGLLEESGRKTWIEIKSVSLRERADRVSFPDAVTTRGSKHLDELMLAESQGDSSVQMYVITRGTQCAPDVLFGQFGLADEIDPLYAQQAFSARSTGVRFGLIAMGLSDQALWVRGYARW